VSEIEWRDPPARYKGSPPGIWIGLLEQVAQRPGEWACVRRFENLGTAQSRASDLRTGNVKLPPGKWEFAARGLELFARYIGPE
jgi:hypothetical protein